MKSVVAVSLADLHAEMGEERLGRLLAGFSCAGLNDEVENYLKETALRHTLKNTSVTHLVLSADMRACLAYYTLAIKPFAISAARITARQKKEMYDVAKVRVDSSNNEYSIAAYLIAQIGRNFAIEDGGITGDEILNLAFEQIRGIKKQVGGKVVFVEYEKEKTKLLDFYKRNFFEEFKMPSDGDKEGRLGQLFLFLK